MLASWDMGGGNHSYKTCNVQTPNIDLLCDNQSLFFCPIFGQLLLAL